MGVCGREVDRLDPAVDGSGNRGHLAGEPRQPARSRRRRGRGHRRIPVTPRRSSGDDRAALVLPRRGRSEPRHVFKPGGSMIGRSLLLGFGILVAAHATQAQPVPQSPPTIGSPNTVTADPPVPRPRTTPCRTRLFTDVKFADFSSKSFAYA